MSLGDSAVGNFTIDFYEDENGSSPVDAWLSRLTPIKQRAVAAALQYVLEVEGPGVCASPLGKRVAQGIFELRISHTEEQLRGMMGDRTPPGHKVNPERMLLRIFCHAHGDHIVLLLAAYDKAEHPQSNYQQRQIEVAKKRLRDFQNRQKGGR